MDIKKIFYNEDVDQFLMLTFDINSSMMIFDCEEKSISNKTNHRFFMSVTQLSHNEILYDLICVY